MNGPFTDQGNTQKCRRNAEQKSTRYPKTHLYHWLERVHKPTSQAQARKAHNWAVFLQAHGERHCLSLGTPNKQAAAARAREIYTFLSANGWAATFTRYRRPLVEKKFDATLGEYLEAVRSTCSINSRTLADYAASLRRIITDIVHFDAGDKFDCRAGGRRAWLEKIHRVKLAKLTPQKIQEWKIAYLAKAAKDPLSQRAAKISVNSILARAKSLFAKKIISRVEQVVELPPVRPFSKVEFEPRQSVKYHSEIDLAALFNAAGTELAGPDLEAYKVFLLAITAGLRRKEIDLLEWSAFDWDQSTIQLRPTRHFSAKSLDSYGVIQIEPELMQVFRRFHIGRKGDFVIESIRAPETSVTATYVCYRCTEVFDRLCQWLRDHGVRTNKPLHTLRKEFGSDICRNHGIYAASRALRHAELNTTVSFYTDSRSRVAARMSHLLPPAEGKIIPIAASGDG
jgi:integrase